jgi:hypothetical protein
MRLLADLKSGLCAAMHVSYWGIFVATKIATFRPMRCKRGLELRNCLLVAVHLRDASGTNLMTGTAFDQTSNLLLSNNILLTNRFSPRVFFTNGRRYKLIIEL